jgi:hypothetical protein
MPIFYEDFPESHIKRREYVIYFESEALMTVNTKDNILWDVTQCISVEFYGRFGWAYYPIFRVR